MHANETNDPDSKIIYPKLSYKIVGICFDVHNELGRFAREAQYANLLEERFREARIPFKREFQIGSTGNRIDFIIDDLIILELRAKATLLKIDYYQMQRYLQALDKKLGLLVNFRSRYLKPVRVIKIDPVK